jgi:2-polyprenyl-3-methyl-5-hydroxy-6-metoxy-1,4-benzoquinol methylase
LRQGRFLRLSMEKAGHAQLECRPPARHHAGDGSGGTMDTEAEVARHYTRGDLERTILEALAADGKDPDRLAASDLAGVDEFHLGWRASTVELAQDLQLSSGQHVLDIGSGIGGPARYMAEAHGCQVTGIDLTEEFVRSPPR